MTKKSSTIHGQTIEQTNSIKDEIRQPFLYVGIGASAGGLEAIEKFFLEMSSDSNLAFIIIQHLSPDYKSIMPELMKKWTSMNVNRAENGMRVQPNSVYLIPPKKEMTIFNGSLYLNDYHKDSVLHLPIDTFFRSLALDQGKNSIGIILSGTGSDGTLGIKAIKEAGGSVVVQDPLSAKFDGMPKNAIGTGMVEMVLPPEKIPQHIIEFVKHPYNLALHNKEKVDDEHNSTLQKILYQLKSESNVDFSVYKPNTIVRRLERRVSINKAKNLEEYLEYIRINFSEIQNLYKDLLIGVTQFFRDTEAWLSLEKKVIPTIIDSKKDGDILRVWTAGCSTGEEAYSLAILLYDYCDRKNKNLQIKIFATDLDKDALDKAGSGVYPESIVADVKPDFLKKYFKFKNDGSYQIIEKVRKLVVFATHNIINDPPFSKIDLITCRNLLIYLKSDVQKKILNMFHYSTTQNGYIFLGSSESLNHLEEKYDVVDPKWKIYLYKNKYHSNRINDIYNLNIQQQVGHSKTMAKKMFGKKYEQVPDALFFQILDEHVFNGLLVDDSHNILHIFGEVKKYISIPRGKANWDLFNLINKNLYTVVTSLYHKVKKDKISANLNKYQVKNENEVEYLNIHARYIQFGGESYYLLFFEPALEKVNEHRDEIVNLDNELESRVSELERELKKREENLQTTIEELETSNEELQASNEELVSANEELQSTNEELQSVNEELYTVNSEYQKKIEELTTLNSDVQNLLDNTNIGSLYLDSRLNIRRFTSGITRILNILDVDIGRPLSHISSKTNYDKLFEDVSQVIENLQPITREVGDFDGNWYQLRIKPYRESDNSVNGVIVILDDITNLKMAYHELNELKNLYQEITGNINSTVFFLYNEECRILIAEGLGMNKWGQTKAHFEGKFLEETIDPLTFSQLEPIYRFALTGEIGEKELIYKSEWYHVKTIPIYENGEVIRGVAIFESIHYRKLLENKCSGSFEFSKIMLDNLDYPGLMVGGDFEVRYLNKKGRSLFTNGEGLSEAINLKDKDWKFFSKTHTETNFQLIDLLLESDTKEIKDLEIVLEKGNHKSDYYLDLFYHRDLNQLPGSFLMLLKPKQDEPNSEAKD